MNNEATECWRLLFNLVDELREEAARRNRNMEISEFANVTVGQMRILKAVFAFQEKYPDGVMLKLLAEKVNLTPGAASIIVDTLVKQGILDRPDQRCGPACSLHRAFRGRKADRCLLRRFLHGSDR